MKAALHPLERDRLADLINARVLETPPDEKFDTITELLADFCECPVALISLVDQDRQWFKSKVGLNLCETPREHSICAHAILQEEVFIIPDTWDDVRTVDNPLCNSGDRPFRFYAGIVLKGHNDLPLGTLCVLDHKPRNLSDQQKRLLRVMANQVETLIDMKRHIEAQEVLQNEMDHRVKNSLQSVLSLIRLYSTLANRDNQLGDAGREAFEAIQRRVESIALLHEALHKSRNAEKINLSPFLTNVVELLQGAAPPNISLVSDFASMTVTSKVATSIAVIISEFCANSIKHGFQDLQPGEVKFSVSKREAGETVVICEDNGRGNDMDKSDLSERKEGDNHVEGLGLRLMEASATQIGGLMTRGPIKTGYRLDLTIPSIE